MHTIQAWLRAHNHLTKQEPLHISQADLRRLVGHWLNQDNAWIFAHQDFELSEHGVQQLNQWLDQLVEGRPLAYITGQQLFWDLDLLVDHNTLIPRADTETVIELTMKLLADTPPGNILDLGTGSGALALALAKEFPGAHVTGIDQSLPALMIAKQNAERNQITNVQFIASDWFSNLDDEKYDLIVSNPPYIAADDEHLNNLKYEPTAALVSGQNGLADITRITEQAADYLTEHGLLVFEHGWQQKNSVQNIMNAAGFCNVASTKDLAGIDRVTYGYKN